MPDRSTTISGGTTGAYDEASGILYGLADGVVTRWSVASDAFLAPIELGGTLSGIAVSPDSRYLIVGAVETTTVNGVRGAQLHRVDLQTMVVETISVPLTDAYEGGVAEVAISADGEVLFTTRYYGSGWTPLRSFSLDQASPAAAPVAGISGPGVRAESSLIASPDGSRILVLENGISYGPIRVYDSAENRITASGEVSPEGYSNAGRGDISNDGRIVVVTYGTITIHDASMNLIVNLSQNQEVGRYTDAQFSHDGHHLFLFNQETDRIEVYDTASWQLIGGADPGAVVSRLGNDDPAGALDLIDNGRLLLVTTSEGIRVVDLPARLTSEILGTVADDGLFGTVGDDLIDGGVGDDTLFGGIGNDTIIGGEGNDVLVVSGDASGYRLLLNGDDFILKGPDGRDHLTGVETVRFGDGRMLELNRMYGPEIDGAAWADGRIPEALLLWSGEDGDGPLVLPVTPDDEPFVLPGLETGKGGGTPLVPPEPVESLPRYASLMVRLALSENRMLTLDEQGRLAAEPGPLHHHDWM